MGVQITELLKVREISIDELKGKRFAIDSFNLIYQFLTTLRMRDGTPLKDSHGNITSHLTGLFSRTTKLMQKDMKLVFVFDGEAPILKKKERERRASLKDDAKLKHKEAEEAGDIEGMKKYAGRTSILTREMVEEAKELIQALGLPIVQAPSEGEAQAAHMVKKGEVYGLVSQDTDCLLFGTPVMIKNLSITQRRKMPSRLSYETIKPQIIELAENLNNLGIDRDQLIAMGMLVGTDYNIGGIKGIGPKNALKLVKKHGNDLEALFKEAGWERYFDFPWTEVFYLIKKMAVTDDYTLEWKPLDYDKVMHILVDKHDFSKERVESSLDKLKQAKKSKEQKGLGEWC